MSNTQQKVTLFTENDSTLLKDKCLRKENRRLAAFIYAFCNQNVDCLAIRNSYDVIANHPDVRFLDSRALVATLLSLKENSAELLGRINLVHDLMTDENFWWDSDYIGVACYLIATRTKPESIQAVVARMTAFYNGMKTNRRLYVDESYYGFMALLGLNLTDVASGLGRIEQLFESHKTQLTPREQSGELLALALVLNNKIDVNRVIALRRAFKKHKIRFLDRAVIPAIGIFAQLSADANTLVLEVLETQKRIRKQIKFNIFAHGYAAELFFTSAMIVASGYLDKMQSDGADVTLLSDMIIWMQVRNLIKWSEPITMSDARPTMISFSTPKGRRQ